MSSWLDYTINGLIVGNVYALVAVGLALIFGKATFDVESRRVKGAMNAELVVRKGQFALWDGKPT